MNKIIYADNAATTALRPIALEAMKPYLLNEFGNPSQPYSFSRSCKIALKRAREAVASCINADPDEIFSHQAARKAIIGQSKALLF